MEKQRKKEKPASSRQIFCLSGPLHLTSVDWDNFHDRRSVAASLVQGVYILERDRQENRKDPLAHAPAWWEFFNFQLFHILVDDVDNSIFGAIFQSKPCNFTYNHSSQSSPHYVIAFRGTINTSNTRSRDLKLDFLCVRNRLHESSRFQQAMQAAESLFSVYRNSSIWLTGHSLGSAISLLIGKNMTKMGYNVEAYLFNPPFLSAPVEGIKSERLKHGIRFTSSVVKAGLAFAVKGRSGLQRSESEPLHLIPSAHLTINLRHSPDFKHAHGIHQWWDNGFIGLSELHEYRPFVTDEKSIAASLVQGVYVLERDRQKNREGHQVCCAPPWWESFHFRLNHRLIDDVDGSIFGAIYEFDINTSSAHHSQLQNAPNYVIAFRGTLNTPPSISRDLKLDLLCACNRLHGSSRFKLAMKFVNDTVERIGPNIWLTGHSLGSAMALIAGKELTMKGYLIETYLFNPPFLSTPVEIVKYPVLKTGIRFTSSVVKAALTMAIKGRNPKPGKQDPFTALCSWTPHLFVNPNDVLCSEYKGYFEHRKKMEEIGAGKIERISTKNSIVCLLSSLVPNMSCEPLHLLPSACLTINLRPCSDFRTAHGIEQWWDPKFNAKVELHQFK
ncbi:hypothetical protein Gotri_001980 [Gossypium trilobum]|uniref:Fungal lipase-type domain-containing protein n=1 Tax=Gossypium trilobum TaxID=34281 RepID=A0A7J9F762_9ROSI|nr:hypothetical protein [Gossypium trilobum]